MADNGATLSEDVSIPTLPSALPPVSLSEWEGVRYLHLGSEWVQGAMRINAPFVIELEYVRRMMAWLLLSPWDEPQGRHAMQLGLGAGAITKFCWKHLAMRCTAIEVNPEVLAACRAWMRLPPDDERLRVVLADAGSEIRRDCWLGTVDALAVDLYDEEAAAPVLDGADFYEDCRRLLAPGGCMAVNLFGRSSSYERSLEAMKQAFGARALWVFRATREGNTVVLAQREVTRASRTAQAARAAHIEARWGLPARQWMKILKPVER